MNSSVVIPAPRTRRRSAAPHVVAGLAVLLGLASLLGLAALLPVRQAAAADDPSVPKLTVEYGIDGAGDVDGHVVVHVTVTSQRPINGRVDALWGTATRASRPLQMGAGTTKSAYLATGANWGGDAITVELYDGDRLVTKTNINTAAANAEAVGLTAGLAERLGDVPHSVNLPEGLGQAHLAMLQPAQLELGLAGIDSIDTIVAASADLTSLPADQRGALVAWLNTGGILVLNDTTDLSALPTAWRPAANGYVITGLGMVVAAPGAADAGRWSQIIQPTGPRRHDTAFFNVGFSEVEGAARALLNQAGIRRPGLGGLLITLLAYTAAATIGVYLLSKRLRRMVLAWTAIPLLALVTTGGLAVAGNAFRANGRPVASSIVDCAGGACEVNSTVLLLSRDGGRASLALPDGWQGAASGILSQFMGLSTGASTASTGFVRSDAGTTSLVLDMDPGQVTTTRLDGVTTGSGLQITVTTDGAKLTGTITNDTTATIHEAVVLLGALTVEVGDLAPAEHRAFSATLNHLPAGVGPNSWTPQGDDDASVIAADAWRRASATFDASIEGAARVVGWTADLPSALPDVARHTAVVTALAPVLPAPQTPLAAGSVRAVVARSPMSPVAAVSNDLVIRYVVPSGVSADSLVLASATGLSGASMLVDGAWSGIDANDQVVAVPAGAVRNGSILVRIAQAEAEAMLNQSQGLPAIRSRAAGDPT